MGKIEAESSINHFSHPHTLKLVSIKCSTSRKFTCSSCTKEATGLIYICESCNYCLHKPCSDMPLNLPHQVDTNHTLTLLPERGPFQCNACGALGTGFCYNCTDCDLDLHTVCAFMRPSVDGAAHKHTLKLYFEPPYPNKAFICDVCGESGSNHWLYRCDSCQFDAHLKCAKKQPRKVRSDSRIEAHMVKSKSVHLPTSSARQLQGVNPMEAYRFGSHSLNQNQMQIYNTPPVYTTPMIVQQPPVRRNGVQTVVQNIFEGFVEGAANQVGQAFIEGALGC